MSRKIWLPIACLLMVTTLLVVGPGGIRADPGYYYREQKEVVATNGIVASCDDRATQPGLEVLKNGGNAIDAAVTVAFLMGVYEPYSCGIGGHGGHVALYWAETGDYLAIDGSTRTPALATPDMFEVIGEPPAHPGDVWRIKVKDDANKLGYRAMFAPSTVALYWYLMENYGTMSWQDVIAPAIKVAEEGFIADELYVNSVRGAASKLNMFPGSADMYIPGGVLPEVGDLIIFSDLAETMKQISTEGQDAFYQGEIADKIVEYIQGNGGILTKEDFTSYEVEMSTLVATNYRGYTVLTYPQCSNGSIIAEVLNILSNFDLHEMGYNSVESIHVFIEALKLAFIDRYEYVGDRDFVPVPYDGLMSWGYGRERAKLINMKKALVFEPGDPWKYEASGYKIFEKLGSQSLGSEYSFVGDGEEDTTFLCVADKDGNLLLLTTSLQSGFGCKVTVPGTGITLNSSMNNANPMPGHPLSIAPFKRILRNSGPCLVAKDGEPYMILSAPGGRKIITAMLRTLTNVIDYRMGIQAAIDAPRIHTEGNLLEVEMENRIPESVIYRLKTMHHEISVKPAYDTGFARMQGIIVDPETGLMFGGSEPRTHGSAAGY